MWFWDTTSPLECSLAGNQWEQLERRELGYVSARRKREAPPWRGQVWGEVVGVALLWAINDGGREWRSIMIERPGLAEACWASSVILRLEVQGAPGTSQSTCLFERNQEAGSCLPCKWHPAPQLLAHSGPDTMSSSCAHWTPIHREI